ncbi:putative phosphorylase [Venturia nashicola]|nr:putative phosphorylase [Venturia nashicola]
MLQLVEADLDKRFDELVEQGNLIYGPSTVTSIVDDGIPFEFRVCPAFREKPQPKEKSSEEPVKMMGEGSDLQEDPTIEITRINGTHILIYNKFCISKSQMMIVTANSYHRQHDPLDGDDIEAARMVLLSLASPHFIFFNDGVIAGASRKHKHLQVLRMPKDSMDLLVSKDSSKDFPKLPYKYFSIDFADKAQPSKELLHKMYQNLLNQCEGLLPGKQGESVPHDVILTKNWMMVIPRSKRNFEGSSDVNAAGMLGMIWLKYDEEVDKWKELGPARVLRQLGVSDEGET